MSDVKDTQSVGTRLKEARSRIGFTQEQLGKLLGVPTNTVARWEGGSAMPQGAHKNKVVNFLEIAEDKAGNVMMKEALKEGGVIGLAGLVGYLSGIMRISPSLAGAFPLVGIGAAALSGIAGVSLIKALTKVGVQDKKVKGEEK